VTLIREIAHPKALDWLEEFLRDERVAHLGADLLGELVRRRALGAGDSRVERLLALAEAHRSETVRAGAASLRRDLAERGENPRTV
jgi:hypothetical protein